MAAYEQDNVRRGGVYKVDGTVMTRTRGGRTEYTGLVLDEMSAGGVIVDVWSTTRAKVCQCGHGCGHALAVVEKSGGDMFYYTYCSQLPPALCSGKHTCFDPKCEMGGLDGCLCALRMYTKFALLWMHVHMRSACGNA